MWLFRKKSAPVKPFMATDVDRFRPYGLLAPYMSLAGTEATARVVSLHDGDTVTVVLQAFGGYYRFRVRLEGIDACELTSTAEPNRRLAAEARDRLLQLVMSGSAVPATAPVTKYIQKDAEAALDVNVRLVRLKCSKFDKYGRLLGRLSDVDGADGAKCFNDVLLKEKLAYEYHGARRLSEEDQLVAMGRDKDGNITETSLSSYSFWKIKT